MRIDPKQEESPVEAGRVGARSHVAAERIPGFVQSLDRFRL
jgi:hypothetical protein